MRVLKLRLYCLVDFECVRRLWQSNSEPKMWILFVVTIVRDGYMCSVLIKIIIL